MCDVTAAIQGGQAVAEYQAERDQVKSANAAAMSSIASGQKDYNYRTGVLQEDFQQNTRAQNQSEFDAIMAGRAAVGTGVASAASEGVTGKSVSNTIDSIVQQSARNKVRVKDQEGVLERQYEAQGRGAMKDLEQVYASNPLQAAPNPLGVALGIGGATAGANDRQIDRTGSGFLPTSFFG